MDIKGTIAFKLGVMIDTKLCSLIPNVNDIDLFSRSRLHEELDAFALFLFVNFSIDSDKSWYAAMTC